MTGNSIHNSKLWFLSGASTALVRPQGVNKPSYSFAKNNTAYKETTNEIRNFELRRPGIEGAPDSTGVVGLSASSRNQRHRKTYGCTIRTVLVTDAVRPALTAQLRISPARIRFAPRQPKFSSSMVARGAKAKVPKPEPHTAMPVARDRLVSK